MCTNLRALILLIIHDHLHDVTDISIVEIKIKKVRRETYAVGVKTDLAFAYFSLEINCMK